MNYQCFIAYNQQIQFYFYMKTTIGQTIKQIRKTKGMTQAQLGDIVGVTFQQIQKYEKDSNTPSIEMLKKIALVFNVHLISIIEGGNPSDESLSVAYMLDKIDNKDVREFIILMINQAASKF